MRESSRGRVYYRKKKLEQEEVPELFCLAHTVSEEENRNTCLVL